ncbi:MAG: DUF296 domain-containing protein [archaeon]
MTGRQLDSMVIKGKLERKTMRLVFSQGDDVLANIRQAMVDNKIKEARVEDVSGKLAQGVINTFEGNAYKRIDLKDKEIIRASGTFKFGGGDMWGALHVFSEGRKPISGSVSKAIAAEGFELKLSFVP